MVQALAAGGFLRMRVWTQLTAAKQAGVNTNHYFVSAVGGTPATDEDAAVTLDTLLTASYPPLMANPAEYRGVQAQIISPVPPFQALFVEAFSIAGATNGTGGAFVQATQVCGLISYLTDKARQANRGRCYVGFPSQQLDSGGGSPDATYITRLGTLASDMIAGLSVSVGGRTATLVRVLLHGKDKNGSQIVPFITPVTGSKQSDLWATQRRRGNFGRTNLSPI